MMVKRSSTGRDHRDECIEKWPDRVCSLHQTVETVALISRRLPAIEAPRSYGISMTRPSEITHYASCERKPAKSPVR